MVSVEVAEPPDARSTDDGLRDTCGPDGETEAVRFTVPEKLFVLVSVIETVPDEPCATVNEAGLGLMLKLGEDTDTLMIVE